MDPSHYRDRANRLLREISQLESRQADELQRASQERSSALRAVTSITRTTSASTAQSKQRESLRSNDRAVDHDKRAADFGKQIASKRSQLASAQQDAERAEAQRRDRDQRSLALPAQSIQIGRRVGYARRRPVPSERPERVEIIRLNEGTSIDAAVDLGKAGVFALVASVPVIGPVVREVIGVAWSDTKVERLGRFAVQLGRNVEAVQDRMDEEFVRKSEFRAEVEETLDRIILRRNDEKLGRFAAALAQAATFERPELKSRQRFMDLLDQLRPIHVQILDRLLGATLEQLPPDAFTTGQVALSRIGAALRDVNADQHDLMQLQALGLIGSLEDSVTLLNTAQSATSLVTAMGRSFHDFITTRADTGQGSDSPGKTSE